MAQEKIIKNFQEFITEGITSTNKESIDNLAHYLKDRKCVNIEKIKSGKYVQFKSPKSFGLSCKYYSYQYLVWYDFDDTETKLVYHVVDIDKIKKDQPIPSETFTTAVEAAEYVTGKK